MFQRLNVAEKITAVLTLYLHPKNAFVGKHSSLNDLKH